MFFSFFFVAFNFFWLICSIYKVKQKSSNFNDIYFGHDFQLPKESCSFVKLELIRFELNI